MPAAHAEGVLVCGGSHCAMFLLACFRCDVDALYNSQRKAARDNAKKKSVDMFLQEPAPHIIRPIRAEPDNGFVPAANTEPEPRCYDDRPILFTIMQRAE